ncbi:MAG: four helix bundle protein [Deltaproteobacteria bacterium]|nr:four helix bundle protein [Deltaproteobacteria bacterium]
MKCAKLKVWHKSCHLYLEIYKVFAIFSKEVKICFDVPGERASASVPSNI